MLDALMPLALLLSGWGAYCAALFAARPTGGSVVGAETGTGTVPGPGMRREQGVGVWGVGDPVR
jgi:hypothetical protein